MGRMIRGVCGGLLRGIRSGGLGAQALFGGARGMADHTIDLPEGAEYCSTCIIPTDWAEIPLVDRKKYNHDSTVFSFGLPAGKSLNLPVCACVLVRGKDANGEMAVRPYTPPSPNSVLGSFDL